MTDIDEAIDWLGNEIHCEGCDHQDLAALGRCVLKHACVNDRYARRIDRFFDWNPSLANNYITHPHFEVRAIAAKLADVFRLPTLLADSDETVRWNAVRRLPRRYLLLLRNDPHREVRIRVATLLDEADLTPMMRDTDYYVRLVVARRLPVASLPAMKEDEEAEVRRVVASRIGYEALCTMAFDLDAEVRLAVARRLPPNELVSFIADPDWRVRYEAASRVPSEVLPVLESDPDDFVRDAVKTRMERQTSEPAAGGNVVRFERRSPADPSQPVRRQ